MVPDERMEIQATIDGDMDESECESCDSPDPGSLVHFLLGS